MTPSGIELATFRFVAQYLNHCATISGPLLLRHEKNNLQGVQSNCDPFSTDCTCKQAQIPYRDSYDSLLAFRLKISPAKEFCLSSPHDTTHLPPIYVFHY
jgi:hypothetical protein